MKAPSLLECVQGLLTRTYALEAQLDPIGDYVIGDAGLALFYDAAGDRTVRSASGAGARLLLREEAGAVKACLYYPDAMIRLLEERPPQQRLDDGNVDAFAVLVEEVDHLLVTAERSRQRRGVSLLELEIHAEISKYLVLARFLSGREERLGPARRVWLRHRLFESRTFVDSCGGTRDRYAEAARQAVRILNAFENVAPQHRLERLRRFHRAPLAGKLEAIAG